jgi:hypothetical protein
MFIIILFIRRFLYKIEFWIFLLYVRGKLGVPMKRRTAKFIANTFPLIYYLP